MQVPKSPKVAPHAIAGVGRFNLTFRREKQQWAERAPVCKCGRPAVLKAWQPKEQPPGPATELRYAFSCDNTRGPACGFWQAAPVSIKL